jgi:hypothetical protein
LKFKRHEQGESTGEANRLLYAVNSLSKARVLRKPVKHRPRIRLTIRQRTRLLDQWPPPAGAR